MAYKQRTLAGGLKVSRTNPNYFISEEEEARLERIRKQREEEEKATPVGRRRIRKTISEDDKILNNILSFLK